MSQFRLEDEYPKEEEKPPLFTERDEIEAGIEFRNEKEDQ